LHFFFGCQTKTSLFSKKAVVYVHVFWDWVFLEEGFVLGLFGLWKKLLGQGLLLGGFKLKARLGVGLFVWPTLTW